MDISLDAPLVDEILASYSDKLGGDLSAYRNHVRRDLIYFRALSAPEDRLPEAVLVAAAFHDLGIWTNGTLDYLPSSIREANAYLAERGLGALAAEVETLIAEHHKIRAYEGPFSETVEIFRRADLVDFSLGAARFGLSGELVRAVKAAHPDDGFHKLLVSLAAKQLLKTPWRPLPMVRW